MLVYTSSGRPWQIGQSAGLWPCASSCAPSHYPLEAAYWGLRLIAWIHATLHAVVVTPWNRHSAAEPLMLACHLEAPEELGKRSSIERFFGCVSLFFHLQRPPLCGWSAITRQVALTYAASILVGLATQHAGHPESIRWSKRVLAHS